MTIWLRIPDLREMNQRRRQLSIEFIANRNLA
jgi:hypothetical protein